MKWAKVLKQGRMVRKSQQKRTQALRVETLHQTKGRTREKGKEEGKEEKAELPGELRRGNYGGRKPLMRDASD